MAMKKSAVEELVDKDLARWRQFSVSHLEHRAQRITASHSLGHVLLFTRPLHPSFGKEDVAILAETELACQRQTRIAKDLDVSSAMFSQLRADLHIAKKRRLDSVSFIRRILEGQTTASPFPNGGEPARIWRGRSSDAAAAAGPSTSTASDSASDSTTTATVARVVDQAGSVEQTRLGELAADTLWWLLSLIESQEALTKLEHSGTAAEYAVCVLRFAQDLSHSKAVDVAEVRNSTAVRSTRGTVPSIVPFSFVDYSVAGVTRFLVDFHFLESAINFEDAGRRVKIAFADFGMESSTSADTTSTRKAFNAELECVLLFHRPGSHCSLLLTTPEISYSSQETSPCPWHGLATHAGNVQHRLRGVDAQASSPSPPE